MNKVKAVMTGISVVMVAAEVIVFSIAANKVNDAILAKLMKHYKD